VTVRIQGEVTGGGSAYTIHSGRPARLPVSTSWTATSKAFRNYGDDFDRFCSDRDRREDRSQSRATSLSDVIGYEDLTTTWLALRA